MSASFFDMMKYVATGIASPDMTAYDKMRALAAFGGGKTQTLTGIPPISFTATGKPLISWSMLGNGQQSGTPASDAPIMPKFCGVRTANLAPPLAEWYDGYIAYNGSVQPQSGGNKQEKYSPMIPVSASAAYKFSCDGGFPEGESYAWKTATLYDSSGTFIQRLDAGTSVDPFTLNTTATTAYVRLMCRTYGESLKLMLNTGSTALPYEPFGWAEKITCAGQTVPVYLGQVSTVRKIRKLVLTGKENWSQSSAQAGRYNLFVSDYLKSKGEITSLCTHFNSAAQMSSGQLPDKSQSFYSGSDVTRFMTICYADIETLADWKTYLSDQYAAGTPVTVWYVLETPETAIVNEPLAKIGDYADELHSEDAGVSIPTAKGQNTLTVDTELQPSEMSVTGHIKSS